MDNGISPISKFRVGGASNMDLALVHGVLMYFLCPKITKTTGTKEKFDVIK